MNSHQSDSSRMMNNNLRHFGTAASGAGTIAFLARVAKTLGVRDAVSHESLRRNYRYTFARCALMVLAGFSAGGAPSAEASADPGTVTETRAATNADGTDTLLTKANECQERLFEICSSERYQFTPKVREAFLAYAKTQAKADLQTQGKSLPDEFFTWIDSDPEVEAGVYGAHHKPRDVLLWLYSLRLDLGKAKFEEYRQLALAAAIVGVKEEMEADITPREPLELVIPGDPRKPVDTKDPGREPDLNDHIINFLNENTIEEEVVIGYEEVPAELKYDKRGIAIPAPKGTKSKKVPVTETRTRTLFASDVLASMKEQQKFNAYMKTKGQDVQIECGERIVHWNSRDMVRGEQYKKIHEAYQMFRTAYEAKGLLPAARDPFPSPAERCAYLIRNHEYEFSAELQAERKWPRFPLTAPWPILTMLAANNQPLREREERWVAFRDKGEFHTYGEYIGGVAQQHPMQSARRLKPHPFTYATIQMMLKDGGVCGTMGAISSRSHNTLGIPASQASQPGHCAMVAYRYDPGSQTYRCQGGQYATGGDDRTTPFTPWPFEDVFKRTGRRNGYEVSFHKRRPMVYHQSVAWAVNYGVPYYLDSTMAYAVFRLLPEAQRQTRGVQLLESGLALNPYNFLLVDAAQNTVATAQGQMRFWRFFQKTLATVHDKPGCPADGLYNKTVKSRMFASLAKLPVPSDKEAAAEVFAALREEQCDLPATMVAYRLALEGLPALLSRTGREFTGHLKSVRANASRENDVACAAMAATIKATAECIKEREARKQWSLALWKETQGQEKYFGHKYRVATDASVPLLARLSGQKMPPESELMKPILDRVATELKKSIAGERSIENCRRLAAKITATGACLKDPEQKRGWLEALSKVMTGHETFQPRGASGNAKALRDPCSDAIQHALTLPQVP